MNRRRASVLVALSALFALTGVRSGVTAAPAPAPHTETIVLAGGCFWGMEGVFAAVKGVTAVMPGYAGGAAATAHYDQVSSGTTGHAESVRVTYDPERISLEKLLAVYFVVAHDPTELDRQGPDEGSQYRSAIFYAGAEQKRRAEAVIAMYASEKRFAAPIVTKLEPLHGFYAAEDYHRNFMARHPDYPYIVINDAPKLAALHKTFPQLVRPT